jgi:hypothetical protein
MNHLKTWKWSLAVVAVLALVAGLTVSCSSKSSPTAPSTGGNGTPTSTPPPSGFSINLNVSPSTIGVAADGSVELANVTVSVRDSHGNPPPTGSVLVLTISPSGAGTLEDAALCNSTVPGRYCVTLGSSGNASLVFTPSGTFTGTLTSTAQVGGAADQRALTIESVVAAVFHIDHITPNVGDPAGGQHATIFGQNIVGPVKVDFNGTSAQVLSVSPDRIVVVVPPLPGLGVGQTQAVNVNVTNAFGSTEQATDTITNGFVYSNGGTTVAPQVFSVTPTTGPETGNTQITIKGSGFQSPVQVLFDMGVVQLEAPVDNVTSSQIVARTPDITQYVAAGTLVNPVAATIKVINLNSGFSTTAGQQFFYGQTMRITSISPGQGSYTGGSQVTIFGNGFDEPVAVTIAGIAQQVLSASGDQIVIRTVGPLNAPACGTNLTGEVVVTNIEGGASATGASFTFIGPANPTISSVSTSLPNNAANTGTPFTITGSNLPNPAANARVLFGGSDGSLAHLNSATPTTITGTVPAPPAAFTFNSQACSNSSGTGTQSLPTAISVTVRDLTTGCESTATNAITLNPSNGSCVITNPTVPTPTPTPSGP